MARWLTILVAMAVAWPAATSAHRSAARELLLQLDARGAVGLWRVELVGSEALLMSAVWDRDRNGSLSDEESKGVAVSLLSRGVRGVTVTWDGAPLEVTALEPRLEGVGERSLAAVGLATFQLPAQVAPGAHVLRIAVADKSGPLAVQIQTLDSWRLGDGVARAADGRGLAQPMLLAPGRDVELRVTAGSSP